MNRKFKDILFLLILGSICTALLLSIKGYTYPKIVRYQVRTLKTTILDASGIAYSSDTLDDVFTHSIRQETENGYIYYRSSNGLYIFQFEGRGLWGPIKGVVTLNPDLETIESIRIISQEETPGLGGRITELSFLSQFKQKKAVPPLELVMRRKAVAANEVDAISGATITSSSLVDMINKSVEHFRKAIGASDASR